MEILIVVFVVAVVLMVVGYRASKSAGVASPHEDESTEQRPREDKKSVDTVARHYVHRSSMILGLCSHVKGSVLAKTEHEELLDATSLDVMVVLEDPTRADGALLPVSDALTHEGIDADTLHKGLLAAADKELAELPITWTTRSRGFVSCESKDTRAPARLLRLDAFNRLPFPRERALVIVPTLDTVLVADLQDASALEAMLTEADARFTGDHWFSLTPFALDDGKWTPRFHQLPEGLGLRFLKLSGKGVLADFRDAMDASNFPAARAALVGSSVHATWIGRTSVVIPPVSQHGMLTVIEKPGDEGICLDGQVANALITCCEREGHPAFSVLDETLFPPRAVLDFLSTYDDAETKDEDVAEKELLAAMKKDSALVLPLHPPLVLFADGRTFDVTDEEPDTIKLIEAMSDATMREWSERVHKSLLLRDSMGTLMSTMLVVKKIEDAGKEPKAVLKALDEVYGLTGLQDEFLTTAVELAVDSEDTELIRTWVRRGLKEQPLNQGWRTTLTALNVSSAMGEKKSKKPFDLATVDEAGPRASLMPVLRPPGHAQRSSANLKELAIRNGATADSILVQDPQRWPLARGLEIELVYDMGRTMQPLTMMDAAGGLAAELKSVALLNVVAASCGNLPEREGAWFPDWTDGFAASRLLIEWEDCDWMSDEERTTDVIAFTPVYDGFLVAPAKNEKALEAALKEAEQMVERADTHWRTLLTALPWRYDGEKKVWVEHEFAASHPLAARVAALEKKIVALRAS
ncbi:MAG: hypothetical protein QM817_29990 [Archangium sp.]